MKSICLNNRCYIKGIPLHCENRSEEHIIPNALGGYLVSDKLVCKEINTNLFSQLDAALAKSIELLGLITIKRQRGEQKPILGSGSDGFNYKVKDGKADLLPIQPIKYPGERGQEVTKITKAQKEEYIKSKLRKDPTLTREEIERNLTEEVEEKIVQMTFQNQLGLFTNNDSFRAIAKIATNFAILNNFPKKYFPEIIEFIKSGDVDSGFILKYFYPNEETLIYNIDNDEVSHILYLKGCPAEGLLFCYIELFNTYCFLVILNPCYSGFAIEKSHIRDVRKGFDLVKPIKMKLSRSKSKWTSDNDLINNYNKRIKRVAKIYNRTLRPKI